MSWDVVIIGQGLAGSTLAWQLRWAGWRVLVVDRDEPITSSKIAAGLITPVTGQRIAVSWRVHEMLPAARAFYRRVESLTGATFFHERSAVRLFSCDDEVRRWESKRNLPEITAHLTAPQPQPLVDPDRVSSVRGGFEMAAAQLDVPAFLAATRAAFAAEQSWLAADVLPDDVHCARDSVSISGGVDATARFAIFCQGFAATRHPLFSWVPFKAAKGEILTLAIPGFAEARSLHRGLWLAPGPNDLFRAGSTYDWDHLDTQPTGEGRAEILERLTEFLRLPVEVRAHHAAVRPIIRESKAVIGLHPVHQRLGFFNGLGSKGSLHAPFFAAQFASFLTQNIPIEEEVDLRKNF